MQFELCIRSASPRNSGQITRELATRLQTVGAQVQRVPEEKAQDLGATLVLILGTAAAVEVAKGIADLIRRDRSSSVKLTNSRGESIEISGISEHAATNIRLFLEKY